MALRSVIALIDYGAGNLTSVKKALGGDRRRRVRAGVAARAGARDRRHRAGRRPLRRHPRARRAVDRRRSAAASATGGRCSASASACSGCSKAATKRRTARAWACSPGRCYRLRGDAGSAHQGAARRLEQRSTHDARRLDRRRRRRRRAGVLHAQLRRAGHRRHRRADRARRAVRLGRPARPRRRRPVPSREVGRRRAPGPPQLRADGAG